MDGFETYQNENRNRIEPNQMNSLWIELNQRICIDTQPSPNKCICLKCSIELFKNRCLGPLKVNINSFLKSNGYNYNGISLDSTWYLIKKKISHRGKQKAIMKRFEWLW